MNTVQGTVLGLVIAMGGWVCLAQEAPVPFDLLPQAPQAQPQQHLLLAAEESPGSVSFAAEPAASMAAGFEPVHPPAPPRIMDRNFFLLNSLHLGMAILDVEMTQSCMASHRCKEGNPLMPSSQAGQLAVSFAFVAYGTGVSYWLKKHKSRMWWLPPVGGMATHAVGAATGLEHQ